MENYLKADFAALNNEYEKVLSEYKNYVSLGLSLDMSRGKPSKEQLELSIDMLKLPAEDIIKSESGVDARNYGAFDGLPEAKSIFGQMLGVPDGNIFIGGASSLNLMFDAVSHAVTHGVCGGAPWGTLKNVKFLCPVPGYDRHFGVTEWFGIEMINIPMDGEGPDMNEVKRLVESDESVKGIWCVPMYSNPSGVTYSDRVVKAFAALKPKAKDFRIFWDCAYCVHHISDAPDVILNIFDECKKNGTEDLVYAFASTSKISFAGAGIAAIAASDANLADLKKQMKIQTIGYDKINQLRHVRFFKNLDGIKAHMQRHRAIIEPKFKLVTDMFDNELAPLGIADYSHPNGGYFISLNVQGGCAKRVCALCKDAGVVLTGAGATFPYGKDPDDSNIRIAPTFPSLDELNKAMEVFCVAVKLAALEKLLKK